jgi:hypothetical protein
VSTVEYIDVMDAIDGRPLTVHLSRAVERRLRANIARYNREVPSDPMDASCDEDLAIVLAACAERGLHAGESDERVWTDVAGREHPLPRTVRAPWRMRVRFAWRAAVTSWRST